MSDNINEVPAGIGRQNPAYLFGSAEFQKPLDDEYILSCFLVEDLNLNAPAGSFGKGVFRQLQEQAFAYFSFSFRSFTVEFCGIIRFCFLSQVSCWMTRRSLKISVMMPLLSAAGVPTLTM